MKEENGTVGKNNSDMCKSSGKSFQYLIVFNLRRFQQTYLGHSKTKQGSATYYGSFWEINAQMTLLPFRRQVGWGMEGELGRWERGGQVKSRKKGVTFLGNNCESQFPVI